MALKEEALVRIREAEKEDLAAVREFLRLQCQTLYGGGVSERQEKELGQLAALYLEEKDNVLIGAFTSANEVVGTIAVARYDNRIGALKERYAAKKTAEICRLYVSESLRGVGIGSRLFTQAALFAASRYEVLYLHTHLFLPGGFSFWRKKGFDVTLQEKDAYETIHMEYGMQEDGAVF